MNENIQTDSSEKHTREKKKDLCSAHAAHWTSEALNLRSNLTLPSFGERNLSNKQKKKTYVCDFSIRITQSRGCVPINLPKFVKII